MPAFGFSVGDFIAAIGLIVKVSKAVKDKFGASNEYQHVILELQALEKTMRYLQALQPRKSNADHVNALRGMALTCRIPLQEFLERIQKYEASLGPFATHSRRCLKSAGRKSQWAIFMSDEVAKLRTAIGAKVLSINLLIVAHISESVSRIETEADTSHGALLASILEQRASIQRLDKKIHKTESLLRHNFQRQSERTETIANDLNNATQTLRYISDTTGTINTTVMSLRSLAVQLLQTLHHFPSQVRDTLEQVVRSNIQIYTVLRAIHSSILRAPAFQPEDSVRFEDVLGRTKSLPYEYFRHIEVFNSYLRIQFKGLPGEQKVLQRQYLILDTSPNGSLISEEEWGNMIFPGASLVMSALVEQMGMQEMLNRCPRIGCNGHGVTKDRSAFKACDQCGMEFTAARSTNLLSAKKIPDRTPEPRGAIHRDTRSKQPRANGSTPRKRHLKQDRPSEEDPEESQFWQENAEPSEETKRELRVFKRVHLQAPSPFMQTMHRIDKSHFLPYDIQYVQAKFPIAPDYLVERLGKAISRRRKYLSYRENHHIRIQRQQNVDSSNSAVFGPLYMEPLEDTISQTSYATTVHVQVVAPPLPEAAYRDEFYECPICFRIISIQTTQKWRKHVSADLHPYLCTVDGCDTADRIYQSRHEWFKHEEETHYSSIAKKLSVTCLLCGDRLERFTSFKLHMGRHQEQLAFFALPLAYRSDDDVLDNSESDVSVGMTAYSTRFDTSATGSNERESLSSDDEFVGEIPERVVMTGVMQAI
ncbi:Nn.00g084780.m01.CDS01 [Neocucurbitaria sp. VM-36]